ncbi:hypothetical protein HZ994_13960 [Akkermansiaceae bacterium]|nr:hypothetical protein HZ994_13960 [Akkermansiaceae bacterium]
MNIRSFIGASSAILIAWLGVTYIHEVPTERYHQQTRSAVPVTGKAADISREMIAGNQNETR